MYENEVLFKVNILGLKDNANIFTKNKKDKSLKIRQHEIPAQRQVQPFTIKLRKKFSFKIDS